jgi:S-adenosylmethionine uptake transporter
LWTARVATDTLSRPGLAIICILAGTVGITINDVLIKALSGGYPLHQMVFLRALIALPLSLGLVLLEGGLHKLRTDRPFTHLLRCVLVIFSNMSYFAALAVLPLAEAMALFYVAPLLITLLSVPFLGEKIGPWRIGAVLIGLLGVVLMQRPWASAADLPASRLVLLLPVISACGYAINSILTRRLGARAPASVLSTYIQATFLIVALGFWAVAGDGRFAEGATNRSVIFLLRPWVWPAPEDWSLFVLLGVNSGLIGYCLSQAYRLGRAATIAPFEYLAVPMAVVAGFMVFGEVPLPIVWAGTILIIGAGLVTVWREAHNRNA